MDFGESSDGAPAAVGQSRRMNRASASSDWLRNMENNMRNRMHLSVGYLLRLLLLINRVSYG